MFKKLFIVAVVLSLGVYAFTEFIKVPQEEMPILSEPTAPIAVLSEIAPILEVDAVETIVAEVVTSESEIVETVAEPILVDTAPVPSASIPTSPTAKPKPQATEPSSPIDTTNLKIGDKVYIPGFGYVEYGGPNTYSQSYSTGSFDIMVGNTGVPVGKPKIKEQTVEYIPQNGDIQTDMQTGIVSVYIDGQGFVPM